MLIYHSTITGITSYLQGLTSDTFNFIYSVAEIHQNSI